MMAQAAGGGSVRGRREAGAAARTVRDAARIFWTDVRRTWISFPVSAVVASVIGLYAGGFLLSADATEGPGGTALAVLGGFWFLGVVPALVVNILFNRDYYYRLSGDNLSKRLAFLRGLPISTAALVAGRVLYMLLALVVSAPAFFATTFGVSKVLQEELEPAGALCFVAIWCSYALFAGGFYMFVWHTVAWKTQLRVVPVVMVAYVLAAGLFYLAFGTGLAAWTVEVAATRGPLAAFVALAAGATGMTAWAVATARRLGRRDLFR